MSEIKLHHGDCLDLMSRIQDNSVDMILADLPYNLTQNSWDAIIPLDDLWLQYKRIVKANGAIVLFCKQPFTSYLVMSNIQWYRYNMVWRKNLKTDNLNARKRPMGAYEEIAVFYNSPPTYNPQRIPRTYQQPSGNRFNSETTNYGKQKELYTDRQSEWLMPDDVIDDEDNYNLDAIELSNEMLYFDCVHNSSGKLHPTQKPVSLLEWLIRTYTNQGEIVLDNCMGSGSVGIACLNTGRSFIGIELDDNYFKIAESRINSYQIDPSTPYRIKSNDIKHKKLF